MNILLELGITESNIKNMSEINPEILEMNENEIKEKIIILEELNCSENIIKNIIESNPMYLSRSSIDIQKLLSKLNELNIKRLDITFDSNPWLLNYDAFEIDDFIIEKRKSGMELNDIIDLIDSGMVD